MLTAHECKIESKTINALLSPAIFDQARGVRSNRGRDNILYLQNVVLDFENGELRPHQVPDIFPDLQLIVANTYGHKTEAPRFRVIVLTSAKMGPAAYEALWDAIANKLRDAGYIKNTPKSKSTLKRSGLDYSKRTATSLFYLPAQAENAADSFFKFYNDEGRQPLNPEIWLRNVRLETTNEDEGATSCVVRSDGGTVSVQAARAQWRASPKGQGNKYFSRSLSS